MHKVKPFYLLRREDASGISGTGVVAVGVILPSGLCVMEWTSFHSSVAYYRNFEDITLIHGHGGKTEVIMGEIPDPTKSKKKKVKED
jgi:hypothetical protein